MKKRNKKQNKKLSIITSSILLIIIGVLVYMYLSTNMEKQIDNKISEIKDHYNECVVTTKETTLYNEKEEVVGKLGKNVELTLSEQQIDENTKYFIITHLDNEYYIKYQDVQGIEDINKKNDRYLNYIPFNENINTKDVTNFYDAEGNLVYSFNKKYSLPIIVKDTDKYGIEYNNELLYVYSEDISEIISNTNTDKSNASGVGVLNYHAFYDENDASERADCVTEICHSMSQFKTHLDFFKENNILTVTMDELEKYIDGKIQLPKSVLLTIDDGPKTEHAVDMLGEYQMYATIFMVTSWFDEKSYYKNEYIELHSHTHDMHNGGVCPGGQGGGIKCLPEETILSDLKQSREELGGSTAIAYPFYEYNEYSIKMLKEAGFTMAFIGESYSSDNLVHIDSDKFRLRRFVIVTYTSINDLKNYLDQIK